MDHEILARRFYQRELLRELSGRRVRFTANVERDGFTVPAGATGVVQDPFLSGGLLVAAVELDDPPSGAEVYDNEVHWIEDLNLFDFEDEVELA